MLPVPSFHHFFKPVVHVMSLQKLLFKSFPSIMPIIMGTMIEKFSQGINKMKLNGFLNYSLRHFMVKKLFYLYFHSVPCRFTPKPSWGSPCGMVFCQNRITLAVFILYLQLMWSCVQCSSFHTHLYASGYVTPWWPHGSCLPTSLLRRPSFFLVCHALMVQLWN